ncbi:Hsp20/alpha crystallin family protein [Agrobacterium rubi]|uniref:Hsp20/alpha crystallin family protein n=1 Tax=Agrobacterium rubi TaxID=28099 RepID=A0AAE7URY5_9HYPH|nr:Hsp20/alpha crystallin family protein [Agrobacterium rubi]NTE87794.1 Hsp20/alpha crystallin family protein [Agrobacterium rubi]NTF05207.1 Hsp20/alpha crystallin family protein [Agrobacterium rubi]NTF37888.1 Hsp20/alpha crystallin family protein [Agrobacterium rubi]OCJ54140.1 heat-shock protein Hsp20 [Agrobacterium rubi]QTG01751.1 Hsp20/alpha crystallin family protein [Agrobacterium rubi]
MTDHESQGAMSAEATRAEPVFIPPTDIVEDTKGVRMLLDMPGADPESLDVTLDKRVLRISARSVSSAPEGYTLVHAEYRDGNYERSFMVSEPIDTEKIEALFRDGVLELTLPKAAPSPVAKISVKAG